MKPVLLSQHAVMFILCAFAYLSDWMAVSSNPYDIPQKMSLNILGGKF